MMHADPWSRLRQHTTARIALGRAGGSLPTAEWLRFSADHADARDAVDSVLDTAALAEALQPSVRPLNLPVLQLQSQAVDRQTYLQRPDLGRRLSVNSANLLKHSVAAAGAAAAGADVALIVADGLSATAAQRHAAAVLAALLPLLTRSAFSVASICIVQQARVAIQDEIGSLLQAKLAVILLGERPGLGSADSLGAYLVHGPALGKTDADRNCVSNIRPGQLDPAVAAGTLHWLISQSLRLRFSGVNLKDERGHIGSADAAGTAELP